MESVGTGRKFVGGSVELKGIGGDLVCTTEKAWKCTSSPCSMMGSYIHWLAGVSRKWCGISWNQKKISGR